MVTATRRPHQQRLRTDVDALLDAALSVFATRGFRASTMADVAAAAGTSRPTLYAHFGSKEALFAQVLDREADVCREWLFARYDAAKTLPMLEELAEDIAALFDYVEAHPDGFRLLFGSQSAAEATAVRARLQGEITRQVAELLHANTSPGRGRPGRTEGQLAATIVNVAFSGVTYAEETGTSLDKALATATAFTVGAVKELMRATP